MVIYMLDAEAKKSPRGGDIPRPQVERLVKRLQQAGKHYTDYAAIIGKRFKERGEERKSQLTNPTIPSRKQD